MTIRLLWSTAIVKRFQPLLSVFRPKVAIFFESTWVTGPLRVWISKLCVVWKSVTPAGGGETFWRYVQSFDKSALDRRTELVKHYRALCVMDAKVR